MENYYGENQNYDFEANNPEPQKSGKGQKIAVGALAIFAIFILFMWSSSLKQSISSPFTYQGEIPKESSKSATCESGDCQFEENLKLKDTDQDGLSDWDELNVYGTSPYLEDSDSDGYTDKEEILKNQNPSCPVGRECKEFSNTESSGGTNALDLSRLEGLDASSLISGLEDSQEDSTSSKYKGIRELFLASGQFDEEFLNQFTDEQLFEAYQATLSE